MADQRRPYHLGVTIGLTAGLYAVSLAGVTALQAIQDADIAAAQAPTADLVGRLSTGHDDLEARVDAITASFNEAAGSYGNFGSSLDRLEAGLRSIGRRVAGVQGASISIPGGGSMPTVGRSTGVARPVVHATTTASGH
jgi:hypothetical protein